MFRGYSPQRVERLVKPPYTCVAYPTLGAGHLGGYYDLNQTLPAPGNINGNQNLHNLAISVQAVHDLARQEGWSSPQEMQAAQDRIGILEAELADVVAQATVLREKFDAIDVLASADFRARNKPGRKKAPQKQAA